MRFGRLLLISLAAMGGAIFPLEGQIAIAPISIARNYLFPPVGLGSTETASITVVNNATASLAGGASPVAAACAGTISFFNANGLIGTLTSFSVAPGQFKTVSLPFSSAGLTGIRGEIRGEVSTAVPASLSAGCSLTLSFETYDSMTGATHAVLNGTLAGLFGPILPITASQAP